MNNVIQRLTSGALAGLTATGPMTVAMEAMHDQLPWHERYHLPPRQITLRAMRKSGITPPRKESSRYGATMVSHFGYGTSVGAIYGLAEPYLPGPPAAKGIAYGLAVWAGSYLGLLPALGLLSPATRHPARRNLLMIAAHVIWGGVLGLAADRIQAMNRHSTRKGTP